MTERPRFIAEIGLNYEGRFEIASELIRQVAQAGTTFAKFQFGWRSGKGEMNHIRPQDAARLKEWCDLYGIEMLASIITWDGWELAQQVGLERYKIASRTVVENPALCEEILATGKETFVSLGMWNEEGWPFGAPGTENAPKYLFCVSKYPTYPEDVSGFPDRFSRRGYLGYSDHMQGVSGCLLALARGALIIEKHITLNKTSETIRDHALSATPEEFADLVRFGSELSAISRALLD